MGTLSLSINIYFGDFFHTLILFGAKCTEVYFKFSLLSLHYIKYFTISF